MTQIKRIIRILEDKISNLLPMRNVVLFESAPDYCDNTRAVFDEMVNRGMNKKLKFIWVCEKKDNVKTYNAVFKDEKNIKFVYRFTRKFRYYYRKIAKYFIVCNLFLEKAKPKQHYFYLEHGCALKNTKGKYSLPDSCKDADILTFSEYLMPYEAENLSCSVQNFIITGFPRNDMLFDTDLDLHQVFSNYNFDKLIYWMPTYRQNRWADAVHSSISLPILYNEAIAQEVNACAKENNVLIVIKIHQAQDASKIVQNNLSNLVVIDDAFLAENHVVNYQILGCCDALLTDYSSVYYDYLLCNKPVGLCWDDFDEYNKREGFAVDMNQIMAGGEKIYNCADLNGFISRISAGEDGLAGVRMNLLKQIHVYQDNHSTKRAVDYISGIICKNM